MNIASLYAEMTHPIAADFAKILSTTLPGGLHTVCAAHGALPAAPSMAQLMSHALPARRQRHFLAGRAAVALAARPLGMPDLCPVNSADGVPQWPPGLVGSLSHSNTHAAAVLALAPWRAVGIDVEADLPLATEVAALVLVESEKALLTKQPAALSSLFFSAKECVHKCVFPLNGSWLEFDEVAIQPLTALDAPHGQWRAEAISAQAQQALANWPQTGIWWRIDGQILCLLALGA